MSTRLRRLRTAGALALGVLAVLLLVRAFEGRHERLGGRGDGGRAVDVEPTLRGALPPGDDGAASEPRGGDPERTETGAPPEPVPMRTIRGRVLDGAGHGVAALRVLEWRPDTASGVTDAVHPLGVSDAYGRFEARVAEGRTGVRTLATPDWLASRVVPLPPGADEVVLRVRRATVVRGVVLGPRGQPVAGARGLAETRRLYPFAASEPTDADGRFLVQLPLHVSPLVLWCDAPHTLDDRHVWRAEAWIDLPRSDEVVLRFVDGVSIEGEVVDHEGERVAKGRIVVRSADDEPPVGILGALRWDEGRFRVSRLAPGPYQVSFERWTWDQAVPAPVRVVAPARGVRIVCPEPHDLGGRVIGEGAHDFVVTYTRPVDGGADGRVAQEQRAQGGAFTFRGVTRRAAVLYAYRPGDDRYALLEDVHAPDDACALVLVEGLRIEGRLLPPVEGFPTQLPRVGVEAPFTRRAEPVRRDGTFVVSGLPAGTYPLYVLQEGHRGHVPLGEPVAAGSTGVVRACPE